MTGAEPARLLEWDSAFWGVTIGRVEGERLTAEGAAAVDEWAGQRSVDCLYFLARADDPGTLATAQESGYRFVDVRVELRRALDSVPETGAVREHRPDDLPELKAIARASHENTRFFADARFPDERCRDHYETWIEESCRGWADAVLVAEGGGRVAGYVTCHAGPPDSASIGLLGVAEGARGGGVGAELVSAAVGWASGRRCRELSVVTQAANVPAQRLYQRCGFRTAAVGVWFHKWYET